MRISRGAAEFSGFFCLSRSVSGKKAEFYSGFLIYQKPLSFLIGLLLIPHNDA